MRVPCGKCIECLKTKQNDYMVRIYEEMLRQPKCCFLTLTYSNANVPYFERDGKKYMTVWKSDIKDWLKRFRTNYERLTGKKGIRMFGCSEYGPRTHRPHYHFIFFGLDHNDLSLAIKDWSERFGFVLAKDVDCSPESFERTARYVSKYCCKGILEDPFRRAQRFDKTFSEFFERVRPHVCIENEAIPYFFIFSKVKDVASYSRLLYPWKYKDFRVGISGRGIEA